MGESCLINNLNKLKDSAQESVESLGKLDKFKSYLHVDREPLQSEYLNILKESSEKNISQLILVCGSAGCGKSHVTSYLCEKYLFINEKFKIINDATESYNPKDTCIDTLNEELQPFSDENIYSSKQKLILLINLGTLSNFITSQYASKFTMLKKYVEDNRLLDNKISEDIENISQDSRFKHINFSDYKMYSLSEKGVDSLFLKNILDKVTGLNKDNEIYNSYKTCCTDCKCKNRCPIKLNYEYLLNEDIKNNLVQLIIEIIIKYKFIVSTRAFLNFIFTIIVPSNLNGIAIENLKKAIDKMDGKSYVASLLPNLLYKSPDRSDILKHISLLDPMSDTNESLDQLSIEFFISNDKLGLVEKNTGFNLGNNEEIMSNIESNENLYTYLIRMLKIINNNRFEDYIYKSYIDDLFRINTGNSVELSNLYGNVLKATFIWNGRNSENKNKNKMINMNIGIKQFEYTIFQELNIVKYTKGMKQSKKSILYKFNPYIELQFCKKNHSDMKMSIEIDYMLYELIFNINNGYLLNRLDKTEFIKLDTFVKKISNFGNKKNEIFIVDNRYDIPKKFILTLDNNGDKPEYIFEEI